MNNRQELKHKAQALRRRGFSYAEIANKLGAPKGTVYFWNKGLRLSASAEKRLAKRIAGLLAKARVKSAQSNRNKKIKRKELAVSKMAYLAKRFNDMDTRKLILGALYLGEGSKGDRGGPTFGNSDPEIITLFLRLLREAYLLDEKKFRCTLQAREGQEIKKLEKFWSQLTKISPKQFYKARIDSRSKGQLTRNPEYKGVCRIDYFSTDLLYEILAIGTMLTHKGP